MNRRILVAILAVLSWASTAPADAIGDKVVKFCKDHLGKKVDDGECANLAHEAPTAASGSYSDAPKAGDHVWGKLVLVREMTGRKASERTAGGRTVQAGDVIQFRDVKLQGKMGKGTYALHEPQHTAVVGLKDNGRTLVVLEQNTNGRRFGTEGTIRLDDLKEGWRRVYRPQAK